MEAPNVRKPGDDENLGDEDLDLRVDPGIAEMPDDEWAAGLAEAMGHEIEIGSTDPRDLPDQGC